jgi:hypothetical protein
MHEGSFMQCAVERRESSVGESPTRQLSLQPAAIGAVEEVTNPPKPLMERSRMARPASRQAATRVNAEQAPKIPMRKPTRLHDGEGCHRRERRATRPERVRRGSGGGMSARRLDATRETPHDAATQPDAREGQAGSGGESERPIAPLKPAKADGGKGPWFKETQKRKRDRRLA